MWHSFGRPGSKKKVNVRGFKLKLLLINFCRSLSQDSCPPGGNVLIFNQDETRSWFTDSQPRIARAKCHIPIWISRVSGDKLLAELRNAVRVVFWITSVRGFFVKVTATNLTSVLWSAIFYLYFVLAVHFCQCTFFFSPARASASFAKVWQSAVTSLPVRFIICMQWGLPSTKRVKVGIINPAAAPDVAFVCWEAYPRVYLSSWANVAIKKVKNWL